MPDLIEIPATDGLRIARVYAMSDNLAGRSMRLAPAALCRRSPGQTVDLVDELIQEFHV